MKIIDNKIHKWFMPQVEIVGTCIISVSFGYVYILSCVLVSQNRNYF